MLNVMHVVGTFALEHGGATEEIGNHCIAQAAIGYDVRLFHLDGFPGTSGCRCLPKPIEQKGFAVWRPAKLGYSWEFARELKLSKVPDIYHVHGPWHFAQIIACRQAVRRKVPYVYHLMGGFTEYELSRKPLRKKIARYLYQDEAIRNASCIHVNGYAEADFLRGQGFVNPIAVLPVGTRIPSLGKSGDDSVNPLELEADGRRILLFLARVHPTKGPEHLIQAWQHVCRKYPDWILVMAGAGEPRYVEGLRARVESLGLANSVRFTGLLTESQKTWCYRNAAIYVLPSFQENFGNTVAEALSFGVPVITTTRTPWAELEGANCGWLVEPDADHLQAVLLKAMGSNSEILEEMGWAGRKLVQDKYSLDAVVGCLDRIYSWVLGGERPQEAWLI